MNNGMARAASGAQGHLAQKFLSQDRLVNEQFLSLRNNELRTYKLSKSYEKTSALKECTLKMHAGEVFCLLGHNGTSTTNTQHAWDAAHASADSALRAQLSEHDRRWPC